MARYPQRIAPFLHLPVQSGCTATLHRMGRPYSAEAFEDTVRMIRANLPQVSLSCDVIVGFPRRDGRGIRGVAGAVPPCGFLAYARVPL